MPSTIRGSDDFDSLESQGLGDGQTWQDMKASRDFDITYTNSTGRPIGVSFTKGATGTSSRVLVTIDGVALATSESTINRSTLFFIVPAGSAYIVSRDIGSANAQFWSELR